MVDRTVPCVSVCSKLSVFIAPMIEIGVEGATMENSGDATDLKQEVFRYLHSEKRFYVYLLVFFLCQSICLSAIFSRVTSLFNQLASWRMYPWTALAVAQPL
jgi:hypothetical protein